MFLLVLRLGLIDIWLVFEAVLDLFARLVLI